MSKPPVPRASVEPQAVLHALATLNDQHLRVSVGLLADRLNVHPRSLLTTLGALRRDGLLADFHITDKGRERWSRLVTIEVGSIWRNKRSGLVSRVDLTRTTAGVPVVLFSRNGAKHALPRRLFVERYTPARCLQCGQPYAAKACGPSHALVAKGVV